MPTTPEESRVIVDTMLQHLSPEAAAEISEQLWDRVGRHTENASVRVTLEMIRDRVIQLRQPPPVPPLARMFLVSVVGLHFVTIVANLVSACLLVVYGLAGWTVPTWSIAFPVVTLTVWMTVSRYYDCPLTRIEDAIRERYNRQPVKAFLKHYVVDPIRRRNGNGEASGGNALRRRPGSAAHTD